ncbi:MAG TPA: M48 family metallopeptidase [Candidatus Acidoferrum sp.]|nr:M48 family metallopeptidase [Candidatus Acidoferrum sp.]
MLRTLGAIFAASLCLLIAPCTRAQRTQFKAGWNLYSPQEDIKLGKEVAVDAEKQLPSCNAPRVDAYLTGLGKKLIVKLPTGGVQYPFEFHCVNDKAINAFALPGGYVFVNRGTIEAADDEAQLAGVIAHELSHVALRHGTAEATKAKAAQAGVGILGVIFGENAGGALLTELGRFSAGGVLLRYSRAAETQADVVGTQVLYDAGYDPRALAQFFEKIEADSKGQNPPEFFSDHPNPERRVERVDEEIDKLGGLPAKMKKDSVEFETIKREVLALPVVKKGTLVAGNSSPRPMGPPPAPSANYAEYQASAYVMKYPDNWRKYEENKSVSFAPDGGVMEANDGQGGLAYGIIVDVTKVQMDASDANALDRATHELIGTLQEGNPKMKIARQPGRVRVNGQPGLSTYLDNGSPAGGAETDWLITVIRPEGLVSFVFVAPQKDYEKYDKTFASILDSVRFQK